MLEIGDLCAPALRFGYIARVGAEYISADGNLVGKPDANLFEDLHGAFDASINAARGTDCGGGLDPVPLCPRCRRGAEIVTFEQDGREMIDIRCSRCGEGRTISSMSAGVSLRGLDVVRCTDRGGKRTWTLAATFGFGHIGQTARIRVAMPSGGDPASSPITVSGSDFVRTVVGERADIEKAIRTVLTTA